MKFVAGIVGLVFVFSAAVRAEMHEFNLPDGRSIKAEIVGYNARINQVELKLENGRRKKIDPTIFVKADQTYITEWASLAGFRSSSVFKISCSKDKVEQWKEGNDAEEIKYEKFVYEVALENKQEQSLDNLNVEYRIYYEQEKNDSATKKVVTLKQVKAGKLDLKRMHPKEKRRVSTEPVVLSKYEFNMSDYYVPDGDPESTSGEIKGIWLRVSIKTKSGQTAVREVYEPGSVKGKYVW